MTFLDSAKKILTKTAKDAAKVSGELAQQTKLRIKMVQLKDEINTRYTLIGELYFGVAEYDMDNGEKINTLVEEIKALKEQLEELGEELGNKKTVKCLTCGSENEAEALFCSKCGAKLN